MRITLHDTNTPDIELTDRLAEIVRRVVEIKDEIATIGVGAVTLHLKGRRVVPETTTRRRANTQDR